MDFFTYCKENDIFLLKDDISFINLMLKFIKSEDRKSVMHSYVEIWLQAMNETDIVYKKQNIGRRAANNFLREYKK